MKEYEKMWMKLLIFMIFFNAFWVWTGFLCKTIVPFPLCMIHIFDVIIILSIYSIRQSRKARKLEEKLPKIGNQCFGYIYKSEANDNNSKIYHVVVHTQENENKVFKYRTFSNLKLRPGQVVKGYYYKDKVVLEKKKTEIESLPQNIIDAFELNNEKDL